MAGRTPEETDRLVEQAISQQNMQALLDLLELDAAFVDPISGAVLRGRDRIRQAAEERFESNPRIVGTAPPKVWIAGDLALVLSKWSMEGSAPTANYSARRGRPPT